MLLVSTILNSYVWPNVFVNGTYQQHVEFLRNWVLERMDWLDAQMDKIVPSYEPNTAPTANAGTAFSIYENSIVTLRGSGKDKENDELTYLWEGPEEIYIEHPENPEIQFIAPEVDTDTPFTFRLTVSDGELSATAEITVTVLNRTSSGISDLEKLVKVYPNPVRDQFVIQFYSGEEQAVHLAIYSVTGQQIYQQAGHFMPGNNQVQILRSALNINSKVLFYQLRFENQTTVTGKILVD